MERNEELNNSQLSVQNAMFIFQVNAIILLDMTAARDIVSTLKKYHRNIKRCDIFRRNRRLS